MKSALISQSNYIPWSGFFSLIFKSQEYILLDDVQFTRRDWRNRNKIKIGEKSHWLSIPLNNKGQYANSRILDMKIWDENWTSSHLAKIDNAYRYAPYWQESKPEIHRIYNEARKLETLTSVNYYFLNEFCKLLKIECRLSQSTEHYTLAQLDSFNPSERLVKLVQATNSQIYLTGPSAKNYIDLALFDQAGIEVLFADYEKLLTYPQGGSSFSKYVSIIDLIANVGFEAAPFYLCNNVV